MIAFPRWPVLVLALSATACGHVPLTSLAQLSRVDFATTDLSMLRAGVALPESLQPLEDSVKLTMLAEMDDGVTIRRSFTLEEVREPAVAADLLPDAAVGKNVHVYRLSAHEAADLEATRADLMDRKRRTGAGGRLEISIGAGACRTGLPPSGPLPMSTYLKTGETNRFVPLTRDVDLHELASRTHAIGTLPSCV